MVNSFAEVVDLIYGEGWELLPLEMQRVFDTGVSIGCLKMTQSEQYRGEFLVSEFMHGRASCGYWL
jgi:hypothetical protein